MRAALALALLLVACKPTASVQRTTPITNLASYRTLALRVRATGSAPQELAPMLEQALTSRLAQVCQFDAVVPADSSADLVLDLNITSLVRGGTGYVRNEAQVETDTLMILSDGQDGQPMGTAAIRGKSSGTIINDAPQDKEAIEVTARTIGKLLATSGCTGPRVARVVTPPDTGSAAAPPVVDESKRAEAEALNEQGKELLFAADLAGARAKFEQALQLVPDAKYQFNVCIALGAQERTAEAITACEKARTMAPPERLAAKIDQRLEAMKQAAN